MPSFLEATFARLNAAPSELLVMSLHDASGRYIASYEYPGTRGTVALKYRPLVARALSHRAHRLLLLHNHPSGDPTPSVADIAATANLTALFLPLELALHDHLIVGGGSVVSMRRAGLFPTPEVL